jgi:pantoate--beta-alanine ligase
MKIVHTIRELKSVAELKSGDIGFVPTMGALHEGHISLVEKSTAENLFTIVSIFVNPTQFNDKNDLNKYPRELMHDCKILEKTGCNIVFAPEVKEMYPKPDKRIFNFGSIEDVMEGKYRPGHFNGVAQIVTKFFDIIEPKNAYFGLKDFQQLAVIKKIVNDYNYQINIVPCQIIREANGLAMSSRNKFLDEATRKRASLIFEVLKTVKKMYSSHNLESIYSFVTSKFEQDSFFELEYFNIVSDSTLHEVTSIPFDKPCTACIAVFAGKIRLIDNIQLNS